MKSVACADLGRKFEICRASKEPCGVIKSAYCLCCNCCFKFGSHDPQTSAEIPQYLHWSMAQRASWSKYISGAGAAQLRINAVMHPPKDGDDPTVMPNLTEEQRDGITAATKGLIFKAIVPDQLKQMRDNAKRAIDGKKDFLKKYLFGTSQECCMCRSFQPLIGAPIPLMAPAAWLQMTTILILQQCLKIMLVCVKPPNPFQPINIKPKPITDHLKDLSPDEQKEFIALEAAQMAAHPVTPPSLPIPPIFADTFKAYKTCVLQGMSVQGQFFDTLGLFRKICAACPHVYVFPFEPPLWLAMNLKKTCAIYCSIPEVDMSPPSDGGPDASFGTNGKPLPAKPQEQTPEKVDSAKTPCVGDVLVEGRRVNC